jgi:hypothetical protein
MQIPGNIVRHLQGSDINHERLTVSAEIWLLQEGCTSLKAFRGAHGMRGRVRGWGRRRITKNPRVQLRAEVGLPVRVFTRADRELAQFFP